MGIVSSALLAAAGLGACGWLLLIDAAPGLFDVAVASAPCLVGLALAASPDTDRRQHVARLFAAALMLPLLLAMWAGTTRPGPGAPATAVLVAAGVATGCALLAAWAALLLWTARTSTRIEPAPTDTPDSAGGLRRRIEALTGRGWPLQPDAVDDTALEMHLDVHLAVETDGTRWHTVRLVLDKARHEARVREDLGARGARPQDASGASLRGPAEPYFDPARPQARWISGRVRQATMIEPALLDALSRSSAVRTDGAGLPEGDPAILAAMTPDARSEHIVSLLAAVVTAAGWTWQPVLLERRRPAS